MSKSTRKALKNSVLTGSAAAYAATLEQEETTEQTAVEATAERLASEIIEANANGTTTKDESSEPAPRNTNLAPAFTTLGTRNEMGFGCDSETAWLTTNIHAGTFTRPTLQTAFLARFVPADKDGNQDTTELKRKKISFSVFLSDVKRPIGTYHASRNLPILVDEAGILSFDQTQYDTVKAAIAAGILTDLKGITAKRQAKKYSEILSKHGLKAESK
jgi:hypothetical protein